MKKIVVSAIQPSNKITLGNYLGAIKNYLSLPDDYLFYLFVADLHVITNPNIDFKQIQENKKMIVCLYQACGLDLEKTHVFFQSDVPAHSELAHILMCHSYMGELTRMTQYKDKQQKFTKQNGTEYIPAGLFSYPVLMAADILLYDANLVPVGSDQKQHLELTRNIAERMNKKYGRLFTLPEPLIMKSGARIMDLQNPEIKMSKSNVNEKGTIFVLEDLAVTRKKIMSAKTDSLNEVKFDFKNRPGVSNLINIYQAFTNLSVTDIEKKYQNKSYKDFKQDLADIVCNELGNIQKKYQSAYKNYSAIQKVVKNNGLLVNKIANKKLEQVQKAVGIK